MNAAAAGELSPQGSVSAAGQPGSATPAQLEPRQSRGPFTQQVRQRFGRGAGQYEQEARLQQAMAWRLARLCADLPLPAGPRADLGAGTGLLSRALQQHHPELRQRPPLQLDLCPELLARNPLAGLSDPLSGVQLSGVQLSGGQLSGGDVHSDVRNDIHSGLLSKLRSDPASDGPSEHGPRRPGGPGGSRGQTPVSQDPLIGSACASNSPASDSHHDRSNGLIWDLNRGLPDALNDAALLVSSFALQWLENPAGSLAQWCQRLGPGGWLVLAVPTAGSFPQWRHAAEQAGVPCTALVLPEADALLQAARSSGLSLRQDQRLRFSRPRQGGQQTLRHLQRLGASASPCQALSTGQLRRLLRHWPATSPLTWEVLLLIAQRQR